MNKLLYLVIVVAFASCSPTRHVIPLGRKEKAVSVSVGGPIITKDQTTMPQPMVSLTYAYGKTKNLTYITGFHASAATEGYYAAEFGVLKEWWFNNRKNIGFTTNMVANVMVDKVDWGVNVYPQLDANLYWHYHGDPHYQCDCKNDGRFMKYIYVGVGTYVKVVQSVRFSEPFNEDILMSPHLGYNFGGKHWKLNAEVKWIQPWADNTKFDYPIWNPLSDRGTFGGYLSFYKFF